MVEQQMNYLPAKMVSRMWGGKRKILLARNPKNKATPIWIMDRKKRLGIPSITAKFWRNVNYLLSSPVHRFPLLCKEGMKGR